MNPCPRFEEAPERARDEYGGEQPTCCGTYIDGSGGHTRFANDCGAPATWWHPDDTFAFCDAHVGEKDKRLYANAWAKGRE